MDQTITAMLVCIGVVAVVGFGASAYVPDQAPLILGLCTLICTQLLSSILATRAAAKVEATATQAADKVEVAAARVEEVKEVLSKKSDATEAQLAALVVVAESAQATGEAAQKVGEATHTLVNSGWGVQLKINMLTSQRVAEYSKDPVDIEAAKLAKELYREHQKKQAVVDASQEAKVMTGTAKLDLVDADHATPAPGAKTMTGTATLDLVEKGKKP